MVTDERETVTAGVTQVNDHNRVHSQVHDIFTVRPQMNEFGPVQVADEDRVLKTLTIGLHQLADPAQPHRVADVIGDQVSPSVRPHLVIIAVYWSSSPIMTAPSTRA